MSVGTKYSTITWDKRCKFLTKVNMTTCVHAKTYIQIFKTVSFIMATSGVKQDVI